MPAPRTDMPVASPRRGPVLACDLTSKQEHFARAVALDGMNLSDAYRVSHCADRMAPATVWTKASALARRDKVRARIEAIRAEMERKSYDDAGAVRRLVIERLHHESLNAKNDGARIRALELLGRLDFVGMFKERQEVEFVDNRTSAEILQEIRLRLHSAEPDS